jgi:hypothetical protein
MKPAERISDLKILQVNGGAFGGANGADAKLNTGILGSNVSALASTLLQAGAAYPMFKELLSFAKSPDGEKLTSTIRQELDRITANGEPTITTDAVPVLTSPNKPSA